MHAQRVKSLRNTPNKAESAAWPRPSSEEQSLLGPGTYFPCVGHFLGSDTPRLGQVPSPFMHLSNSSTLRPKEASHRPVRTTEPRAAAETLPGFLAQQCCLEDTSISGSAFVVHWVWYPQQSPALPVPRGGALAGVQQVSWHQV